MGEEHTPPRPDGESCNRCRHKKIQTVILEAILDSTLKEATLIGDEENSSIWVYILDASRNRRRAGRHLPLYCCFTKGFKQLHPAIRTKPEYISVEPQSRLCTAQR